MTDFVVVNDTGWKIECVEDANGHLVQACVRRAVVNGHTVEVRIDSHLSDEVNREILWADAFEAVSMLGQ